MIEQALIFALGFLVAGLVWLLMLPAFWRRAVRLTRARVEQVLPLTLNEIEAEKDRLRAAQGVEIARLEQAVQVANTQVARARAETGERLKAEADLLATITTERARVLELEARIESLTLTIAARDTTIAERDEAVRLADAAIAGLEAQRETLSEKLGAAVEVAETRRRQLDEARVLGERAREALDVETRRNAELRNELQNRAAELRAAERQLEDLVNRDVLARIKGGEETYRSVIALDERRHTG